MTITRIIGDVHCKYDQYRQLVSEYQSSIQVGDFGIGLMYPHWEDELEEWQSQNPDHRFIRGNHDNPSRCKTMPGYIPDGKVENHVMMIGGAWSIDWQLRHEGLDWWRDEELSIGEFYTLFDVYNNVRPRIMITHDAPTEITYEMFVRTGLAIGGANAKKIQTLTGQALQEMHTVHQPDFWFFGHWHRSMAYKCGNTTFVCLKELDYIDVDLEDSAQILTAIDIKFTKENSIDL